MILKLSLSKNCRWSLAPAYDLTLPIIPSTLGNVDKHKADDGMLNIKSEEKYDAISIYDSFGKLVLSSQHKSILDLTGYDNGLFFIELIKGNKKLAQKIVRI